MSKSLAEAQCPMYHISRCINIFLVPSEFKYHITETLINVLQYALSNYIKGKYYKKEYVNKYAVKC